MGKSKANNLPMIFLYMPILSIMAGCVPALFRAHPQLQEKVTSIKTVAIMPPSVRVYQLSAGGDTQLMDDLTAAATQHVAKAIEERLKGHAGFVFTPFPSPSAIPGSSSDLAAAGLKDELEDTQALFEAVSTSVLVHTYEPKVRDAPDQTFPEKLKNFDYSLGPDVERLAQLANANALLFVSGVDHISTGGRKGLIFLEALIFSPVLLHPLGALSYAMYMASRAGRAILSVAMVDATTGALLWYNVVGLQGGGYSLTDPHSATDLTVQAFEDFPVGGRPTRNDYDRSGSPRLGGALQ